MGFCCAWLFYRYSNAVYTKIGWPKKYFEFLSTGFYKYSFIITNLCFDYLNIHFSRISWFAGLFLVAYSIIFGIETAKGFKWMLQKLTTRSKGGNLSSKSNSIADNYKVHAAALILLVLVLALLWCISGVFEKREFSSGNSAAQLWLACMVGPFGVWMRWFLARFNGRGLGKNGFMKWVPFGTLIANVSAACIMAVLAVLKKVVRFHVLHCICSVVY